MRMKMAVTGIGAGVVLVGGAVFFTAFAGKPTSYMAAKAAYTSVAEEVEVTGDVHGEQETTYYAEVTAPISSLTLSVGDSVNSGDQLLAYDTADLEDAVEEAVLTAESSESSVKGQVQQSNENQAKYDQAAIDEMIYQYLYAAARADSNGLSQDQYQEGWDINCIADGINQRIAGKQNSAAEKTKEMNGVEDKTSQQYKDLASQVGDLNIEIASLQKDLANLPSGEMTPEEYAHYTADSNLMEDITRNWTQATTEKNTYENQILNGHQKNQLETAHELTELGANTAQGNLLKAQTGVNAEFAGIVTTLPVKQGAIVTKGTPLLTIESSEALKVDTQVSKYDIGKIKEGQRALITIAGSEYDGSVSEIKRFAQGVTSDKAKVTVVVHIDHPDENVYLGLEADVTIYTQEKDQVLTIPAEGRYVDDDGDYCYVIRDGIVAKQYFTAGISSDETVEVLDGIKDGETVITDAVTDEHIGRKAVSK
ncbi:MAG: HlyD family efflux transporter periplasmic adaptor subunit [Lachnospiraceae bacterium]